MQRARGREKTCTIYANWYIYAVCTYISSCVCNVLPLLLAFLLFRLVFLFIHFAGSSFYSLFQRMRYSMCVHQILVDISSKRIEKCSTKWQSQQWQQRFWPFIHQICFGFPCGASHIRFATERKDGVKSAFCYFRWLKLRTFIEIHHFEREGFHRYTHRFQFIGCYTRTHARRHIGISNRINISRRWIGLKPVELEYSKACWCMTNVYVCI